MSGPEPRIEFQWYLWARCNYACPYCSFVLNGLRDHYIATEKVAPVRDWIEGWRRIRDAVGRVRVNIVSSGEPTRYPGFIDLVASLSELHDVIFDSNLSWSTDELRSFAERTDPARVSVHASFHPLDADLDGFLEKAAYLRDRGYPYQCRMVAYPPFLKDLPGYQARFQERGLIFVVTPYNGPYQGLSYPDAYDAEQKTAWMSGAAAEEKKYAGADSKVVGHLYDVRSESPLGKLCRSGSRYAAVMPSGKVYRCSVYGAEEREPLGDFFDPAFSLNAGPTRCAALHCGCEYRFVLEENPAGPEPAR